MTNLNHVLLARQDLAEEDANHGKVRSPSHVKSDKAGELSWLMTEQCSAISYGKLSGKLQENVSEKAGVRIE